MAASDKIALATFALRLERVATEFLKELEHTEPRIRDDVQEEVRRGLANLKSAAQYLYGAGGGAPSTGVKPDDTLTE